MTTETRPIETQPVESHAVGLQRVESPKRTWVEPDFRDVDTPMEVTAYAARG